MRVDCTGKLGGEVAIGLGVARLVAIRAAQHILDEEELRIGPWARSHTEHDDRGVLRHERAKTVRDDLKLGPEGSDGL